MRGMLTRKDEGMPIDTRTIGYRDGDTELTGLFVWENSQVLPQPGILVVHGGAGLDEHAKGQARQFAVLGYMVFACDMYGNGVAGNRERVMARIKELRSDPAVLCRRARAGLQILATQPEVDGCMAAVGYCFGGMTVLEMARSGVDLAGVVSIHGSLDTPRRAEPGSLKAKVLVCHGALDLHVPMTQVNDFVVEMNAAGADWELILYGGAMHGFTHEAGPQLAGVAYHAQADARSAAAMQSFFAELFAREAKSRRERVADAS